MKTEKLPELTPLEVSFLQLLPVDSLAQGMAGASFHHLANDLGMKREDQQDEFILNLISALKRKGVKVVVESGSWAYLSSWDSLRLAGLIDPEDGANMGAGRSFGYGGGIWKQSTQKGSLARYHGSPRDDT